LDLVEPRESESTLLNLDVATELFDFLPDFPSRSKKASIAFLRTVVMTFLDLKSAGVPPVMKIRPPSLCGSSLAGGGGLCDVCWGGRPTRVKYVSLYSVVPVNT
jgi:hypothetical protein